MWSWIPWELIIRQWTKARGYLDPILLLGQLRRFSQPAEVFAPGELLRAGLALQARGLINSQAIQHNLDWIWPYWIVRQFDPRDNSFVPRAFNFTHINLTHRNWTAVGLPGFPEYVLIDPRGLVTPFFDGWSIDSWILSEKGHELIPSRSSSARQRLVWDGEGGSPAVETFTHADGLSLFSRAEVFLEGSEAVCRISVRGTAACRAKLAVSLRPYNPEGVSFVHRIGLRPAGPGWIAGKGQEIRLDTPPAAHGFSDYRSGDVYRSIHSLSGAPRIDCPVGMASAAAVYEIAPESAREVRVTVPLGLVKPRTFGGKPQEWSESMSGRCRLASGNPLYDFLYEASLTTMILHSPGEVYPGPYTYKRFWFRDAAFILYAMLCVGLEDRVEAAIDRFPLRQTPFGYFLSQEGEWDSNGEALWIMNAFCEWTGRRPKENWRRAIIRGARWIVKKRLPSRPHSPHAGLFPPGFSAEHFGPNDYYYWDDFWGVAGLTAASRLAEAMGDTVSAATFRHESEKFFHDLEQSIAGASDRLGLPVIPASPYRRLDGAAIGPLVAGYPLRLYPADELLILRTADHLFHKCLLDGGFFQDISHSGINPYLSLHLAQSLLRAGDPRFAGIMNAVARMATPTGQWPEAIHPRSGGGCMGDGQHVWASAEWVMMLRNCLMREEEPGRLILCSGLLPDWFREGGAVTFGPAPTSFGRVSLSVRLDGGKLKVDWKGAWRAKEPRVEIRAPGFRPVVAEPGQSSAETEKLA